MGAEAAAWGLGGAVLGNQDGDDSTSALRQISDFSPIATVVAASPDFRIVYADPAAHRAARTLSSGLVGELAASAFAFVDPVLLATKTTHRSGLAVGSLERHRGAFHRGWRRNH